MSTNIERKGPLSFLILSLIGLAGCILVGWIMMSGLEGIGCGENGASLCSKLVSRATETRGIILASEFVRAEGDRSLVTEKWTEIENRDPDSRTRNGETRESNQILLEHIGWDYLLILSYWFLLVGLASCQARWCQWFQPVGLALATMAAVSDIVENRAMAELWNPESPIFFPFWPATIKWVCAFACVGLIVVSQCRAWWPKSRWPWIATVIPMAAFAAFMTGWACPWIWFAVGLGAGLLFALIGCICMQGRDHERAE